MRTYLQQATPEQREALAVAVKSSVGYFYLIGGGHRRASPRLAKRLVEAEPKLTLSGLRPDIWSPAPATAPESPMRRATDGVAADERKA
ncbi:hypothetical protein [Massilia haematophila]|uniref:Transcriptional regulator n=1 Tax=Massilia haematophila TaxID=457923 RepID=A0ABV7PI52_9BURK